ncbi:MAG: tRNA (adenosine(37)-N6)-threonylcarbamoyltransferase complex transferase subunit TsaD [Nanoarchaeota archaeon]|nr:tRNA (adenosine(37)-N6)-threonylcarbamoyltransferase complex transferase subunit TsaD [Nanoarchaeota archaeon]MBU1005040.1 tRNA (adenosine(37)-N6)-threonylcarbamoyltransferase complex transferase subunit TsaD [Nanoarchaeota archaeon]MBU1946457.1 tRNA (adenosine(37)-N6)-threonylcarbamoyltransferase complex transferase subunit TsaD [Nanoarchaeota archaeon]
MKGLICLGIESTAHTFGAGIMDDSLKSKISNSYESPIRKKGKILANVKDSYTTEKGGIHPTEAKNHHIACKDKVVQDALDAAGLSMKDIDLISFSQSPGMAPCLVVGMEKAKALSAEYKKPIIGINHCIAHLEIGRVLCKCKDPVMLYASGANTQIIAYDGGKYRIFGETLDNGVGNFLDGFARHMGLGFPGGPKIYELALKGKEYIELPYVVKGMDVSFGGIQTNLKQKFDSGKFNVSDLCYSCQETVFAMLVEVAERAMAHCEKKELLLGGGVACNIRLQEMCKRMCAERNAECYIPPNSVMIDNGAMIAWEGLIEFKSRGGDDIGKLDIKPYERTDDVKVSWR